MIGLKGLNYAAQAIENGVFFSREVFQWLNALLDRVNTVSPKIGDLRASTDPTARVGELEADGSAVSRATYGAYFALVGTAYGSGDGSTTFTLPYLSSAGADVHYFVRVD